MKTKTTSSHPQPQPHHPIPFVNNMSINLHSPTAPTGIPFWDGFPSPAPLVNGLFLQNNYLPPPPSYNECANYITDQHPIYLPKVMDLPTGHCCANQRYFDNLTLPAPSSQPQVVPSDDAPSTQQVVPSNDAPSTQQVVLSNDAPSTRQLVLSNKAPSQDLVLSKDPPSSKQVVLRNSTHSHQLVLSDDAPSAQKLVLSSNLSLTSTNKHSKKSSSRQLVVSNRICKKPASMRIAPMSKTQWKSSRDRPPSYEAMLIGSIAEIESILEKSNPGKPNFVGATSKEIFSVMETKYPTLPLKFRDSAKVCLKRAIHKGLILKHPDSLYSANKLYKGNVSAGRKKGKPLPLPVSTPATVETNLVPYDPLANIPYTPIGSEFNLNFFGMNGAAITLNTNRFMDNTPPTTPTWLTTFHMDDTRSFDAMIGAAYCFTLNTSAQNTLISPPPTPSMKFSF